jgi:gliding motility-associated-like protein
MKGLATAIFIFTLGSALAQPYSSANGFFTVDQIRGCAPFTLTLNAPSCDGTVGCDVDFEGTGTFQSLLLTSSHTYALPGTYTITLIRGAQIDNIQIEVFENIQPEFELVTCGANRVFVFVTDQNYQEYFVDFNDGSSVVVSPNTSTQHSYATSGAKTVTVRGRNKNARDNCSSNSKNVTVVQTLAAAVLTSVTVLDQTSVRIAFTGQNNTQYRVEVATNSNSSFQQTATLFNTFADTIRNITPDASVYCFRIKTFDPCSNQTLSSNIVCSNNLDVAVENNQNVVTWSSLGGTNPVTSQQLVITPTNSGTSFTVANASNPYIDTEVVCGTEYCYRLTTFYSNGSQSMSLAKCGTAISTDVPASINNISSVVEGASVELAWLSPSGYTADVYSVYRVKGSDTNLLKTTAATEAVDSSYTIDSQVCYRISYSDVCGNRSELGITACPIILSASLTSTNEIVLSWSDYNGWENGAAGYVVEKFTAQGGLLASFDVGTATTFTDDSQDLSNQRYLYRVTAIPVSSAVSNSKSNTVDVIKDPNLFYPTSFTPNGDALNDVFNVYGQYISVFEMDIFNRWGELMYTTTNLDQGWDGNFNGTPMPEGTYTFVARITDLAGRNFKKSGSILLLKKNR